MTIYMPHKRSFEARQRRAAKRLILDMAYRDKAKAETINRLSVGEIVNHISRVFGGRVHLGAVPRVEVGEVLADPRGEGSFQRRAGRES